MNSRTARFSLLGIASLVLPLLLHAAEAPPPDKLVESVARQLLTELDARRAELRKEPQKIRDLVDKVLLPNFDTEYSAQRVLAVHWRNATPDQRKRFIDAFYKSLLQNYGEALLDFTPDRLKILPYKEDKDAPDRATVRTLIKRDSGSSVAVNYTLRRVNGVWKAWDVTIDNVSYVKTFQQDFASEINANGMDAVIARLEAKQGIKSAGGKNP
jgi:phospholipid transport system substrate-binding protein